MPVIIVSEGADLLSNAFDFLNGYNLAEVISNKNKLREYVLREFNHVIDPRAYMQMKDFTFSMRNRKSN